jgi:hypothetical protein
VLPRGYSEVRKNIDNSVQLKKKDNNPEGEAGEQDPGVPEDRRQKTEDRRQKNRRQKAEGRRQKAEGRRQKAEARRQKPEDRGQGTGDRGQGAEDGKRVTLPGCHGQR